MLVDTTLASRLLHDLDVSNDHILPNGLAHIKHRQGRHRRSRQGLHLDARVSFTSHSTLNLDATSFQSFPFFLILHQFQIDRDMGQE